MYVHLIIHIFIIFIDEFDRLSDGPDLGRLDITYYKLGFKVARYSFQDQYLPSLSINCVAINKDLEKLPPRLY